MRKILMLQPLRIYRRWPMPDDFTGLFLNLPTLAFAQLAGALKGIQADYIDGNVETLSLAELTRRAAAADAVLISAYSSVGALNAEANLRHILETCPGKPVIMGGHHATFYDFEWLARGAHFVVRQEGERTLPELLEAISRGGGYGGIAGLSWRGLDREYHRNPSRPLVKDLDSLPMPDWNIFKRELYSLPLDLPGYATTIESARGCSFRCRFCSASEMWEHTQRFKSPERVLEELRVLARLGVTKLFFADDNFASDSERYTRIYEGMLREGLKFNFIAFMRADTITASPETIRLAYRAGLRMAFVGFETPSARILGDFDKGTDFSVCRESDRILKETGIFSGGFFMVGYMGETQAETDAVFRAAGELSDYPIISIFEPRGGTVDFGRAVAGGDLPGGDMFYHNTVNFIPSRAHLMPRHRGFYRKYMLHPGQLKKFLFGTPTQRQWYRTLYRQTAKSILSVTPARAAHPWSMVRDIYK